MKQTKSLAATSLSLKTAWAGPVQGPGQEGRNWAFETCPKPLMASLWLVGLAVGGVAASTGAGTALVGSALASCPAQPWACCAHTAC